MKNIIYLLLTSLFLLNSCQKKEELTIDELIDSKDIEAMQKRRDGLSKEIDQDRKDLMRLDEQIVKLNPKEKAHPLVTAINPLDTVFAHYIEVQGSVMTKNDAMIYPEYSGVMTRLNVSEGQYVKTGALIATISDGGLNQQIAQQQVQLELAKTTFERQKRLWDQNIGSEIQYLQAKNNYEAIQKGIAAMQEQLKKINVYAPFSGVVEEIITKQGQVVSPGATPILHLVGLGSMYVEADVPENYLPDVRRGTKVDVIMDAIELEYHSSVRRINSTINPASRAFTIEVGVPNNKLIKPNLIANLNINDYTNNKAILVPSDIVSEDANGDQFLFVIDQLVKDDIYTVKRVVVESGLSDEDGNVEIVEGLESGQRVIDEGAKNLLDGQEVQVLDYDTSKF